MTSAQPSIHLRILEDIAHDLSGEVNFPICLDAAILVRDTLKDPLASLERVAQAISVEPLISSKLLRLANSVSYNPSGRQILDISAAISRLGFEVVRTTGLAVALDQMLKSRNLSAYEKMAKKAWGHSVQVAAIARVLAKRIGRVNPDEAMLAGLVHDIGVFYLLFRAVDYPEYQGNETALLELLSGWHASIGESLLHALGMPDRIAEAVRCHNRMNSVTPDSVQDILYFANLLAGGDPEWFSNPATAGESEARENDRARYADLLEEAEEAIQALRAALIA